MILVYRVNVGDREPRDFHGQSARAMTYAEAAKVRVPEVGVSILLLTVEQAAEDER